jgi:elongation factor 2
MSTHNLAEWINPAGQLIPMLRRVLCGAQLSAQPRLMEPVYLAEIYTHESAMALVRRALTERGGQVLSTEPHDNPAFSVVKAYLPIIESFTFTPYLRAAVSTFSFSATDSLCTHLKSLAT